MDTSTIPLSLDACDVSTFLLQYDATVALPPPPTALLISCDGEEFYVPHFELPFSLVVLDSAGPLHLPENSRVVAFWLAFRSREPWPALRGMDDIAGVAEAALRYNMPSMHSAARALSWTPIALAEPLKRLAVAHQNGWLDVAGHALGQTLELELSAETLPPMNVEARTALFALRTQRIGAFTHDLCSHEGSFADGNSGLHNGHPSGDRSWGALKTRLVQEITRQPSGASIRLRVFEEWEEAHAIGDATCAVCGEALFSKEYTFSEIAKIPDRMTGSAVAKHFARIRAAQAAQATE